MINVNQITSMLAKLPDQALQQYAAMHKNDPYIMALAVAESNRRKEIRGAAQAAQGQMEQPKVADQALAAMAPAPQAPAPQAPAPQDMLPEDQGIARLPAGDMNFADGGIVAFARGGDMPKRDAFEQALDVEGVTDPRERAFLKALYAQESSSGKDTRTSNRGARGPMQILPSTFKEVADKGMNINNKMDNLRAGIRYGRQGFRAAGGDPVLGGAYYYGGPGGMQKARAGIAVSDPVNPDAPNTRQYGESIAARMTKLLPVGTAAAAAAPAATAPRPAATQSAVDLIPGQSGQPVALAPTAGPPVTGNEIVKGTAKTAAALGWNTAAMPLAGLATLGRRMFGDKEAKFSDIYGSMTYSPEDRVAREQLETVGRVAQDLKLPPYIPVIGGLPGTRGTPSPADAAAIAKTQNLRLGHSPTPTNVTPRQAAVLEKSQAARTAAQQSAMQTDEAAAAAARARIADDAAANAAARAANEALPGVANRAGLAGIAGAGVSTALANPDPTGIPAVDAADDSYDRLERNRLKDRSFDAAATPPEITKEAVVDAAKAVTPEKKGRGLTGEDWLMLGLGMMQSKSPRFLSALGEAGLGAMKARQERFKEEREIASDEARSKYLSAMGDYSAAQAEELRGGGRKTNMAMDMVNKYYDNWLQTEKANPLNAMGINPQKASAAYQQILQNVFGAYNIPIPAGMGSVGAGGSAQLTPSDLALIGKYTAR